MTETKPHIMTVGLSQPEKQRLMDEILAERCNVCINRCNNGIDRVVHCALKRNTEESWADIERYGAFALCPDFNLDEQA